MDLKKRLAQFDRLARRQRRQDEDTSRTVATGGVVLGPDAMANVGRELGLTAVEGETGTLWKRLYRPVSGLTEPAVLPRLDAIFTRPAPSGLLPEELLFLDTETTGLAGGTGSLAFLVGCGWWTRRGFQVGQFFLPGPGQETPLLVALAVLARSFRVVVTFNGNGFDLPLLRTRALLARLCDPVGDLVSWDLLPAVRRLWGRRLPNCRQQTLETKVCRRPRNADDVDGSQIPGIYFRYLREGDFQRLQEVLRHNRRDMEGMAAILQAVADRARALADVEPAAGGPVRLAWEDAWSNGRIWEARGEPHLAGIWLERALDLAGLGASGRLPAAAPESFCGDAVRILKRTHSWVRVESVLLAALQRFGSRPWLHREAAILYEHRLVRLEHAWVHAKFLADPVRLDRLGRKLASSVLSNPE